MLIRMTFMAVSEQTIPNLLPFLQFCKDDQALDRLVINRVVLLLTSDEWIRPNALIIENFLRTHFKDNPEALTIKRYDVKSHDLANNLAICREIIATTRREPLTEKTDLELVFNMTGGTKIMALANYRLTMENENARLIYLDSQRNIILQVLPQATEKALDVTLSVPRYLEAHGWDTASTEIMAANRATADEIRFSEMAKIIAMAPYDNVQKIRQAYIQKSRGALEGEVLVLARQLTEIGEIPSSFFPGGRWLEYYTFACVRSLVEKGFIDDAVMGLKLKREIENEIDVALTRRHHFLLCSCKVGQEPQSDWIYNLNDRARNLGSFCRKALIVNFNTEKASEFLKRAARAKITVLDSSRLPYLENDLRDLFG